MIYALVLAAVSGSQFDMVVPGSQFALPPATVAVAVAPRPLTRVCTPLGCQLLPRPALVRRTVAAETVETPALVRPRLAERRIRRRILLRRPLRRLLFRR